MYFTLPDEMKSRVESKGVGPTKVVCVQRLTRYGERYASVEVGDSFASMFLKLGFEGFLRDLPGRGAWGRAGP